MSVLSLGPQSNSDNTQTCLVSWANQHSHTSNHYQLDSWTCWTLAFTSNCFVPGTGSRNVTPSNVFLGKEQMRAKTGNVSWPHGQQRLMFTIVFVASIQLHLAIRIAPDWCFHLAPLGYNRSYNPCFVRQMLQLHFWLLLSDSDFQTWAARNYNMTHHLSTVSQGPNGTFAASNVPIMCVSSVCFAWYHSRLWAPHGYCKVGCPLTFCIKPSTGVVEIQHSALSKSF